MAPARSFPFRYGLFRPLLSALGLGPAFSRIAMEGDHLRVRMGWAFRADVPLRSVTGSRLYKGLVGGIGVHGWRGRWLVNGGVKGVVAIDVDPPARARVLGVSVRLRTLMVNVDSPQELIDALQPSVR